MTLAQLRDLLARAHGPAVEREPEGNRSPAGLARVYLGHEVTDLLVRDEVAAEAVWSSWSLARRVQVAKVALALALGLDPGPMGCAVMWSRFVNCWQVEARAEDGEMRFHLFMPRSRGEDDALGRSAPTVAVEPDAVKALELAVAHVLATR